MTPPLFDQSEYADRQKRACAALKHNGLDALLVFAQESMLWLTGYDTFGFAMFQCLILRADGGMDLLTRLPDLRQAQNTSVLAMIKSTFGRKLLVRTPRTPLHIYALTVG